MIRPVLKLCGRLAPIALWLLLLPPVAADDSGGERCLLLHNGNLLTGVAELHEEHWEVAYGGAMLRVRRDEVALVAGRVVFAV